MQKSQYILGKSYDFILIKSFIENHSLYSNEIETMMSSQLYTIILIQMNELLEININTPESELMDFSMKKPKKKTMNRCKSMFRIETSNQAI